MRFALFMFEVVILLNRTYVHKYYLPISQIITCQLVKGSPATALENLIKSAIVLQRCSHTHPLPQGPSVTEFGGLQNAIFVSEYNFSCATQIVYNYPLFTFIHMFTPRKIS